MSFLFSTSKNHECNVCRRIELQGDRACPKKVDPEREKCPEMWFSSCWQPLPPFPFTLLLHKIPSDGFSREMNTVHLLEGIFSVRCNGKCCWAFPYVVLKQLSSFSKTPWLVRTFFCQVYKWGSAICNIFQKLKIRKEIFC